MRKLAPLLALLLATTGCSSLKEATGRYVTEAVVADIVSRVDKKLEERGLSRAAIKKVIDTNKDGKVDKAEILAGAKNAVKDLVALKVAQGLKRQKEKLANGFVSRAENKSVWDWIKGTLGLLALSIVGYVVRHWNHGRDSGRVAVLEKLLQRDLDGDGSVGEAAES